MGPSTVHVASMHSDPVLALVESVAVATAALARENSHLHWLAKPGEEIGGTATPPLVSSEPGPSTPLVRQCAHRLYEIVTFHAAHAACVPLRDDAYVLHP